MIFKWRSKKTLLYSISFAILNVLKKHHVSAHRHLSGCFIINTEQRERAEHSAGPCWFLSLLLARKAGQNL